jgi:hypothetical protein
MEKRVRFCLESDLQVADSSMEQKTNTDGKMAHAA